MFNFCPLLVQIPIVRSADAVIIRPSAIWITDQTDAVCPVNVTMDLSEFMFQYLAVVSHELLKNELGSLHFERQQTKKRIEIKYIGSNLCKGLFYRHLCVL